MSDVKAKKYITRTSKAGTLLLCEEDEENFPQKTSGKRSRQASKEYPIDNAEIQTYNGIDGDGVQGKSYQRHFRYKSDPTKGRFVDKKRSSMSDKSR